jgi:histone-lysine N-methyltransferase SETMAR
MLELSFDSSGIVHVEFIPGRATVNKHRYEKPLRCLIHFVTSVLDFGEGKNWLLLHDNTPAHRSVFVQVELPHPPYSPDLVPSDFFFFPRLKEKLCGCQFQSMEITATREAVWDHPVNIFQQCFQQLYQCWQTCIAANGDYFEGGCGNV